MHAHSAYYNCPYIHKFSVANIRRPVVLCHQVFYKVQFPFRITLAGISRRDDDINFVSSCLKDHLDISVAIEKALANDLILNLTDLDFYI